MAVAMDSISSEYEDLALVSQSNGNRFLDTVVFVVCDVWRAGTQTALPGMAGSFDWHYFTLHFLLS